MGTTIFIKFLKIAIICWAIGYGCLHYIKVRKCYLQAVMPPLVGPMFTKKNFIFISIFYTKISYVNIELYLKLVKL